MIRSSFGLTLQDAHYFLDFEVFPHDSLPTVRCRLWVAESPIEYGLISRCQSARGASETNVGDIAADSLRNIDRDVPSNGVPVRHVVSGPAERCSVVSNMHMVLVAAC